MKSAFLLFMWTLIKGSGCLRMLGVDGPSWINLGDTVTLTCRYDLGRDAIYSMKWYKDDREVYRYIPTYKPEYITFPLPGIEIDVESTRPNQLVLKVLSPLGSGKYSCEITIETPSFRTYNKTTNITVIVPPKSPPKIEGINSSYRSGDLVEINCTSSDSKPAAKLTWFMNGEPIESGYTLPLMKKLNEKTGLETARLSLKFTARDSHFHDGEMRLTCLAEIEQVWKTHIEGIAVGNDKAGGQTNHLAETIKTTHNENTLFVRNSALSLLGLRPWIALIIFFELL